MSEPTNLYRAFDADGALLYIGIAKNWGRRWAQHSERAPWFADVARLHVETHPTREDALRAELTAIAAEKPTHNIVGTRGANRRTTPMAIAPQDPTYRLSLAVGSFSPTSLVGSFFHAGPPGRDQGWQGCVIAEPAPGIFLVELFSWLMGESTDQHLIPIQQMVDEDWKFYDTGDWMRNAYDHGVAAFWDACRAKSENGAT